MILTITPNPALDVTYHLPHAHWGDVNRVHRVSETPGGKGVNVARVLRQLGETVVCTGFLGGDTGDRLRRLLGDVDQRWVAVEQPTRRTTAVVTASDTTLFNEPGAPVDEAAWRRLTALVSELVGEGDVVVLSGSMPPDTPEHVVHTLVDTVVAHDARIIVDTSGPLLRVAARARATLVKPNRDELRAATGEEDVLTGARTLLKDGARGVVASLGEDGMLAATGEPDRPRTWRARPSTVVHGNPTGAGDAAVAALARALQDTDASLETTLAGCLADAVALSASAVTRPVAGEVDLAFCHRFRTTVSVTTPDGR